MSVHTRSIRGLRSIAPVVLTAFVLAGCQPKVAGSGAVDELAASRVAATAVARELHAALDPTRPGLGTTDYPGHAEGDVPKSYAMILQAEVARLGSLWRADEANLARTAGRWLLEHADENGDGIVGWGLPVAWDAYDDGSVNAPNTEYTISTAIAIDALLGWAERDPEAPLHRIRQTVQAAIEPYLDKRSASPSGMAPYSLTAADRRYDTFNPAAYLAGQIQRASLGVADARLRTRYLDAADATMRAVLQHRRLAPKSGHWYWSYSVQQPTVPNDLPHAGYMIAGIRAYIEHGGRLADRFDWYAVLGHLGDFRGIAKDPDAVRAYPDFQPHVTLPARAYDLGFALHLACTETRTVALVPWLVQATSRFRRPDGRYQKYPVGTKPELATAPDKVINEYEAYLYLGLTNCAMAAGPATSARPASAAMDPPAASAAVAAAAARLAGDAARPDGAVPLLPAAAGVVSFDAREYATVRLPEGVAVMSAPGVPVRVLADGEVMHVFLRHHPDNRLLLLRYERGKATCGLTIDHGDDPTAVVSLRAAALVGGRLHAVTYHNPSQANWYLAWDASGPCPSPAVPARALPSLGEPAGATYEMVPALHFHVDAFAANEANARPPLETVSAPAARPAAAGTPRVWLAGGNMQVEVGAQGPLEPTRVPGCRHIVESAVTPRGLAHLCVAPEATVPDGGTGTRVPMRVAAPDGMAAPGLHFERGVPWRLRYALGALQIDHAADARHLRRLLRDDLARTAPGGWMEFGINNEEGRIPWSQVYYLNGWLDLLDLARHDTRALALYGPLLADVRQRLDLEMHRLDRHVAAGRHHTRAFTVDRSRALFGVQTARLLLLMHRYRTEVPGALPLASYEPLRQAVQKLDGHIEVLATEGEEPRWLSPGRHHLRWPRGSRFAFDGMAVPFNHQNEWAYAVLATADASTPPPVLAAAADVLRHFVERIAPGAELPASGHWDYWWGRAYDGWRHGEGWSVNKPGYRGDRIGAWISFKTIDAMSLATGARHLGPDETKRAQRSATTLVQRGALYPLALHAIADRQAFLGLETAVAQEYARTSAPWEMGNAAWALAALTARWQSTAVPERGR